jgi:hypothetical protein
MSTRPLAIFAVCAAVLGCGSPTPAPDAFVAQDAFVARDAFVAPDASAMDAGHDAFVGTDANVDAGMDAFAAVDANIDAGHDGGSDANVDAGHDGGSDGGHDAFVPPDTNPCMPHTFVVTTDGSSYTIDGAVNPTLTLCRGVTYTFNLSTVPSFHPLGLYTTVPTAGVLPTPGTPLMMFSGMATTSYMIPATAPFPVVYRCTVHNFGGAVVVP